MGKDKRDDGAEAFRHILANRDMLQSFATVIARDSVLAEDIFQDTCIEIARIWDRYDCAKPFGPWARGVARNVGMRLLAGKGRRMVLLDDDVLETVGTCIEESLQEDSLQARVDALEKCVNLLSDKHRGMVRMRYTENLSYERMAESLGLAKNALYTTFSRLHDTLRNCVNKKLHAGGADNA